MPAQAPLRGTPASIRASEPPQTVAIEEEPLDSRCRNKAAWRYGILLRRKQIRASALGECHRGQFAAAGAAKEFHFTHAEWREVLVQINAELVLREEQVETSCSALVPRVRVASAWVSPRVKRRSHEAGSKPTSQVI